MSYEERNTIAHLISTLVVVGAFFLYLLHLAPPANIEEPAALVRLGQAFLVMVVAGIVVAIIASILVNIAAGVVEGIKTGAEPEFSSDERDQQIELRAMRVAAMVLGIGVLGAMAALAIGQPAFTVFLLIVLAGAVGDIAAGVYKLVVYRRGF